MISIVVVSYYGVALAKYDGARDLSARSVAVFRSSQPGFTMAPSSRSLMLMLALSALLVHCVAADRREHTCIHGSRRDQVNGSNIIVLHIVSKIDVELCYYISVPY